LTGFDTAAPRVGIPAQHLADNFLHFVLYICILSSFFVFVQPAPYEYIAVVLGVAAILARVRFHRLIIVLLALLVIRDALGTLGLLHILDFGWMRTEGSPEVLLEDYQWNDAVRMLATSWYLGLTGILFACIFSHDTMRRIATLRASYVAAGVIASLLGAAGYFDVFFSLIPGLDVFSLENRAVAGFKDPNVLGCFLIPPLTWLIQGFITDRVRLHNIIASVIIFIGLVLAFSRAAWLSFVLSTALTMWLLFITQQNRRSRHRIFFLMAIGIVVVIAVLVAISSIDVVGTMLADRIRLQTYDLGSDNRARIFLWQDSLREIFNHPFGMGPWGFAHYTGWDSHNSYLGTFLNNGWIGGSVYILLIALTLYVGFKALLVRTPWQTFLIATYTPFIGLVFEAFVIDTDHWRHFYLLVGIIWGLTAATMNYTARQRRETGARSRASPTSRRK
jgi:O-antigen ligase